KYLNAPYLWGGKSPFGIDCSGFTQMVCKMLGKKIKRDAYQQIQSGENVDFILAAKTGDLAFFGNSDNKITHVGIIIDNSMIIHAHGKVRLDKIDAYGIYDADRKKYSHQLKLIKRIF
ncbi:MAG: C40 family peptidase, partial [Chitinophagales bacterium]